MDLPVLQSGLLPVPAALCSLATFGKILFKQEGIRQDHRRRHPEALARRFLLRLQH